MTIPRSSGREAISADCSKPALPPLMGRVEKVGFEFGPLRPTRRMGTCHAVIGCVWKRIDSPSGGRRIEFFRPQSAGFVFK